ncbi:MAG TPA: hypothetical protein VIL85_13040 [Thermomicrobiales bacterium]
MRQHGLLFFSDVTDDSQRRLHALPAVARKAFAVACAERLLTRHEQLPPPEQRPFTIGWRPTIDAIWADLAAPVAGNAEVIRAALVDFYISHYNHDDGPDVSQDAADGAADASIYAAECFGSGAVEPAKWAASCAIDTAYLIGSASLHLDPTDEMPPNAATLSDLARDAMHPLVQAELQHQLDDLALLEREPFTADLVQHLRARASAPDRGGA